MMSGKRENKDNDSSLEKKSFPQKTYLITGAQALGEYNSKKGKWKGSPNLELLEGLEHCRKVNDAELIIMPMTGKNVKEDEIDEIFFNEKKYSVFYRNRELNDKISISDMVVPPANVDPATGRERFVQRENSLVYSHTKQRLKAVPKSNSKLPRFLITTGTVTWPNYNETNHKGDVAARDHAFGAVIVEVLDRRTYNIRQVRAQANGKFVDMGIRFEGKKTSKAIAESLVLGDLHCGDTDPIVREANYEMMEYFKPKKLVIHDLFNGHSVNPHEKNNLITRARNFEDGRLNLEQELKDNFVELNNLAKLMGKREVFVTASNHDFFLDRYLEAGEFIKEPWNIKIATKLIDNMIEGENPVEVGIRMMGNLPLNVKFLKLEEDLKVWGYQLASHGHKGMSGARGSIRSRELAHGKSISGHTHSPEILRDTYVVGTSTKLDLDYTKGQASAWMAANAVLYEGGLVQLLPIVGGKWKK